MNQTNHPAPTFQQHTEATENHAQHFHILGRDNLSALDLLAEQTLISKQLLKTYAQKGAVWIQRNPKSKPERLRRLKKPVTCQQSIDFYYQPQLLKQPPTAPTLIADYGEYSVWLKPRGMLSQGTKWADHTALYRWVEMHYQPNNQPRQCWIVHRLDRATCGLMLLAHTKKMASTLTRSFEEHKIHKTYQALVWGAFTKEPQTLQYDIDGKLAISHVRLLEFHKTPCISRLEIQIETGRKHQIRRHLAKAGFAILGDRMYGNATQDQQLKNQPNLQLSAYQLRFECPISHHQQNFVLKTEQLDLLDFGRLE